LAVKASWSSRVPRLTVFAAPGELAALVVVELVVVGLDAVVVVDGRDEVGTGSSPRGGRQ
jgi:hypothetical protein